MGRKKSKIVQFLEGASSALQAQAADEGVSGPAPALGGEWWVKATNAEFKAQIARWDRARCLVEIELIREAIRKTTLRPHVEQLSDVDQKIAARLAPIHRGRCEALLSRIHGFIVENETAEPAK